MLQDSIQNIETVSDTIVTNEGNRTNIRNFNIIRDWFTLSGWFMTDYPYNMNIKTIEVLLSLEITLTENRNNVWKTYVHTDNDNVTVNNIETKVNPYSENMNFWNKLNFGMGGIGTGNTVGLFGQVGYTDYNLLLGVSNKSYLIGGIYKF